MGSNSAIKKLQLDDDNETVAARLLMLAEQLQTASAELTEVVNEIRKERKDEGEARLTKRNEDRGEDERDPK